MKSHSVFWIKRSRTGDLGWTKRRVKVPKCTLM